ncbi:MAG: hypothetical protein J6D06_02285 [Clostridia bacterium]|nr:hypothetical protein [Clostridia bacterium]
MCNLLNVTENFLIQGAVKKIEQINKGYINRTYLVETETEHNVHKYILQRINTNVFTNVEALMNNYRIITAHLSDKLNMPGKHKRGNVQTLRPTKDGKLYFEDNSGAWRMMTYFDNVYSLDIPENPEVFYYSGLSFGRFLEAVSSVDAGKIKEVIPNFHNTMSRYRDFEIDVSHDPQKELKQLQMKFLSFVHAPNFSV